tara:strand:- start:2482 stop:5184 length:2703 start_codon:yes stop_codon:yes gene_type:complete
MNHKLTKEQIINQAFKFHAQGKVKEAKKYYENFINEGFKDHRVFINYGMILKNNGKLKEAELWTRKAIELKPDCTDAYYNLGIILSNLGKLKEAELWTRKAIEIKPDFADAYSNLGGILVKLGKLQKAELYIQKAIELNPKNKFIENNLISLLTIYQPKIISSNPLYLINQEFKNHINLKKSNHHITDKVAIQIYKDGLEIYKKYNLNLETPNSQIYKRNEINLNCNRHMRIFKKHKIIPEFCFGCYKVQVEVDSIIELIKLFLVFNNLELESSNTRKCMVESRNNVSGFYKGLIYCSGLNEALEISKKLNVIIQNSIRVDLISKVKRGCSEYPLEFPEYKEINISGNQPMNYNEEWRNIENEIDGGNKDWGKANKSIEGFNLNNFLIMRNWVAYAQLIGDQSVNKISEEQIKGPKKFNSLNREFKSKQTLQKGYEIKEYPISYNSDAIKDNLTINKNSVSKEKIIVQACNLHKQGKIKEAKKYYENCINQGLKDHRIFSNYGLILMHSGKLEEGEIYLRKSIKINPNLSETHHNLGIILINSGKLEEGEISLHKAFEINPHLTCVSYSLSKLKQKDNKKNNAWKEKLFSNNFLNNKSQYDQINIYFSRANILHENKSYSESAKYLKLANKLKLDLKPSNADRLIKKSKNLLTESEKTELNNKECSRFPESIFIVGMPRSGSTLLESILSMNKNVKDLGEINILEKSFLESKRINNDVKFADLYWRKISKHKGKLNITTNKWLYNYQYAGIICNQIPNAKIIHCQRNPLDNILSIYRSKFANGHGYSSSLIDCTKVYLDQEKLMTKYKNRFRSKIYDFNYDSLVINTNQQIKELITWLDWKWDNKYLVPHLNKRAVSTASNIQVRAPINANSINGWKNYKNMLKPVIEVLSKTEQYRKLV